MTVSSHAPCEWWKYPASLWVIHWGDQDCWGPGQSNMDTETRRKVHHHWCTAPTSSTSLSNCFPFFLLTFTPLCGGLYSQFQIGSGTNVSFEIIRPQCDRSGTSSRICLRHQSHKADLCSWVLTGPLVFFYSEGQQSSWSYSCNIHTTETENLQ